jgi:hypothetical protein
MAALLRRSHRIFSAQTGRVFLIPLLGILLTVSACQESGDHPGAGRLMAEMEIGDLRFNSDGTFKVVQFTDTQDDQEIDPRTVQLMEAVLDEQQPDLVVFTGDNVRSGPETPDDVWAAIAHIAGPLEDRGIPWFIAFGNHDEDHTRKTGIGRTELLQHYMSYPNNINRLGPTGVHGTGNMQQLIYGSVTDRPVFNVWSLDSGTYSSDTIGGQPIEADGLSGWDMIHPDQVAWYHQTSLALEEEFERAIPSLAFFHIPLLEFRMMWENRENHGVIGEMNEPVSPGPFNSGLFAAMLDRGDVLGIFVGHDHVNDFVGNYFGIRLGYSGNTGFGTYGLDGEEEHRLRGARVFILREDDPGVLETFMVYARGYGIQ